tara:strand:+ start:1158 stop:1349 length:192 start_codon:yes stop_codon:yes gene_type:complete
MYNSFEEEYVAQVQRVRDLKKQGKKDEAALEETTLGSINQRLGYEDISELDERTQEELEVIYE